MSDVEEVKAFFDEIVFGFMYRDIKKAISEGCNFLCALGLVAYTEFMGSLATGKKAPCYENFDRFLEYMGNEYLELDKELKIEGKKGLYDIVRCGLSHEYFIKGKSTIQMSDGNHETGVLISKNGVTCFIVETYFQHFRDGSKRYLQELLTNEEKRRLFLNTIRDRSSDNARVKEINIGTSGESVSKTFSRIMENE